MSQVFKSIMVKIELNPKKIIAPLNIELSMMKVDTISVESHPNLEVYPHKNSVEAVAKDIIDNFELQFT